MFWHLIYHMSYLKTKSYMIRLNLILEKLIDVYKRLSHWQSETPSLHIYIDYSKMVIVLHSKAMKDIWPYCFLCLWHLQLIKFVIRLYRRNIFLTVYNFYLPIIKQKFENQPFSRHAQLPSDSNLEIQQSNIKVYKGFYK